MIELLFLLSFTFHNIEEGLWLPKWSKHAGKYHPVVKNNEFHFALVVITLFGYMVTFLFLTAGNKSEIIKYSYLGFILMMCLNSIFPHLAATIVIKKYAPGTLTGLFLNLPIGIYLIFMKYSDNIEYYKLISGFIIVTILILFSLKPLFRIGRTIIDDY